MAKERKASVIYEGNGTQQTFSFPFDYLRKAFIKAEIIEGSGITELEQGKDYSITDNELTLTSGVSVATGKLLKIYRETTTDPLVEWQDASVLRSADLSLQEVQLLHLAEETADKVFDSGMSTAPTNTNVWDGQYKRLTNLLDPQEDGDAVTLRYINSKQNSLLNALKNEGANQNASIVATGDAQNTRLTNTGNSYVSTMTTLKEDTTTKANEASNSATSASSSASTATTKANEAKNSATSASSSASTATTKATEASNSAELAKKWAMSDSSPDGVFGNKSSKTWANEAKNSATSASSSASTATTKATEASNSASAAAKSAQDAALFDPSSYYTKPEVDNKISTAHNYIKRNTAYNAGDILESPNLPHGYVIVVTQAGTTGSAEPDWNNIKSSLIGRVVSDGTIQFVPYKIIVEKDVSKIFIEKKFTLTNTNVGASSQFRLMNDYNIHVDGYKPLAFAEIHFSGMCSLEDFYWNASELATVWAFNHGNTTSITTELWILYVKDTFR